MKGTEGIDYIITECGHCKGSAECDCYECLVIAATKMVTEKDGTYNLGLRKYEVTRLQEDDVKVKCSVCKGTGKLVFWKDDECNDKE